jgi:transcription elongation GreA/GreB family factor
MGYIAVFLHPGHSTGLVVEPTNVAENMAVTLTVDQEPPKIFVIEPDSELRPSAQYIPPSHPIAEAMLGRDKGDKFVSRTRRKAQ